MDRLYIIWDHQSNVPVGIASCQAYAVDMVDKLNDVMGCEMYGWDYDLRMATDDLPTHNGYYRDADNFTLVRDY